MSHYDDIIMLLFVNVGKHAWCMYVLVCIDMHRWKGKYIFMQTGIHGYVCVYINQTCINLYMYICMPCMYVCACNIYLYM